MTTCQIVTEKHDDVEKFCTEIAEGIVSFAVGTVTILIPVCVKHSNDLDHGKILIGLASDGMRWALSTNQTNDFGVKENDANATTNGPASDGPTSRNEPDPVSNETRVG